MTDGILILDKPAGMTSARAVARVKRLLAPKTKVGHAGTLDPFATGVLLILIGKGTRACERLMDLPKTYEATLRLGATTVTDDCDAGPREQPDARPPTSEQFAAATLSFVGMIQQRPPPFSAVKIGGRRAYELARRGEAVDLPARPVRVDGIEIGSYDWPTARLTIRCGRGFYVRSLARDLGEQLKVGGYLLALRRLAIGPYRIEAAVGLDDLTSESATALLPIPEI